MGLAILVILITTFGGLARLCIFGSWSIKEALIIIITIDVVIGIMFAIFKIFSIEDESMKYGVSLIVFVSLSLIFVTITKKINTIKESNKNMKM